MILTFKLTIICSNEKWESRDGGGAPSKMTRMRFENKSGADSQWEVGKGKK